MAFPSLVSTSCCQHSVIPGFPKELHTSDSSMKLERRFYQIFWIGKHVGGCTWSIRPSFSDRSRDVACMVTDCGAESAKSPYPPHWHSTTEWRIATPTDLLTASQRRRVLHIGQKFGELRSSNPGYYDVIFCNFRCAGRIFHQLIRTLLNRSSPNFQDR